jgi:hypothetical protein
MKHARADYNRIQDPDGKIPADEPVFLLRAQDLLAPSFVEAWGKKMIEAGGGEERFKGRTEMGELAIKHAEEMKAWQKEHGFKFPDL